MTALLALSVALPRLPDLTQMRGQRRVVLIFAENEQDARLKAQQDAFAQSATGLKERDVQVFVVVGHAAAEAAYLRKKFGVGDEAFAVVLIGKDGGSKLKETRVVESSELFRLIDSMPMRKEEMRRSAEKSGRTN